MSRAVATILMALPFMVATASCTIQPDVDTTRQFAMRLERSSAQPDSVAAIAGDIDQWMGRISSLHTATALQMLIDSGREQSSATWGMMLTLVLDPGLAGRMLAKECCDCLLNSDAPADSVVRTMEMARRAYAARHRMEQRNQFDSAFQAYIDAMPIVQQMRIYLKVTDVQHLAAAVATEQKSRPGNAAAAIEALKELLGEADFQEFMKYYQEYADI